MNTLYKFQFIITALLLFSLVFYCCGCYSSYTTTIEPEQVPAEKDCEFVSLKMKDSTVVNLKNKEAKYFDIFNNTQKVIAFNDIDKNTFILKNDSIKIHPLVPKIIRLSETLDVQIEKRELNVLPTVLLAIGIAAIVALVIVFFLVMDDLGKMGGKINWKF